MCDNDANRRQRGVDKAALIGAGVGFGSGCLAGTVATGNPLAGLGVGGNFLMSYDWGRVYSLYI